MEAAGQCAKDITERNAQLHNYMIEFNSDIFA